MSKIDCTPIGFRIENLRGFKNVRLSLEGDHTFLVGPNNSGKSSMLRIVDWLFNHADPALFSGSRQLIEPECELLVPAARTGGRARRITLEVKIHDGRVARRFEAADQIASVRFKVRGSSVSVQLGPPHRGEPTESSSRALELVAAVQASIRVAYVPNAREASSESFLRLLRGLVRSTLESELSHSATGRPPRKIEQVRNSVRRLNEHGASSVASIAQDFSREATGLFEAASMHVGFELGDVLDLLADSARLRLTTGPHDGLSVPASEVGSGLQSLLFVGLHRLAAEKAGKDLLLLLEEPEAFLHPAAQRQLAQDLIDAESTKFIASTHSSAMLDEASAADVVLVRDHRAYQPDALDPKRGEIDSAFLSGQGSEAVFARSVLLVEGPGDEATFEQLRRRIARLPGMSRVVSQLAIVHVGGKSRYAPWIRLLGGYVDEAGSRGISWMAVSDGDATADLRRGLSDAGVAVPLAVSKAFQDAGQSFQARNLAAHAADARALNRACAAAKIRAAVLPFDVEYALFSGASALSIGDYNAKFNRSAASGNELAFQLGSKCRVSRLSDPPKADWMRAYAAERAPFEELHPEIRHVLREWISPALGAAVLPRELRS